MKKFSMSFLVFFTCLLVTELLWSNTTAFVSFDATAILLNAGHNQTVNLMNTLGNTYVSTQSLQTRPSVMFGLGANTYENNVSSIHTSFRYLNTTKLSNQGEVWQLKSPQFRNLTYFYDTQSQLFLIDNIVTWTQHRIQPGIILGLGLASNSATNYHETPLNHRAAPALDHFTNHSQNQFAYELGVAVDAPFNQITVECAYRYINAGYGQLGLSPLQNTSNHLSTGLLQYQILSLGVRIHHEL